MPTWVNLAETNKKNVHNYKYNYVWIFINIKRNNYSFLKWSKIISKFTIGSWGKNILLKKTKADKDCNNIPIKAVLFLHG